jgi:hypothetical protein
MIAVSLQASPAFLIAQDVLPPETHVHVLTI